MQAALTVGCHGHCWVAAQDTRQLQAGRTAKAVCVSLGRLSADPQRRSLEDVPSVPYMSESRCGV